MVGGRNDVPLKAMGGVISQEVHAMSKYQATTQTSVELPLRLPKLLKSDIGCCEHWKCWFGRCSNEHV